MEFVTFEDTTALYDTTLFPGAYRRFAHLLSINRPYILEGVIEEDFDTVTMTIHKLYELDACDSLNKPPSFRWDNYAEALSN